MAEAVGEQLKELAESVGEVVGALNERMAGLEQAKVPDVAVRTLEGVGRSVCSGSVGQRSLSQSPFTGRSKGF